MLDEDSLPQPPQFAKAATLALAICSGGMLGCAMPQLVGNEGVLDLVKAGIIAGGGTIVSYAVTRLAVEKGAVLAAIGIKGSLVVSLLSMAATGAGLFASTYAGLTIRQTEELQLGDFGRELGAYADARGRAAQEAGRAAPILRATVDDLIRKEECERLTSCLSGRADGGTGPVARALGEKRQRAETILDQMSDGENARSGAIDQIATLLARYHEALNDATADQTERRKALQAITADIGTQLNILDEAVPTPLLMAYAMELRTPVVIPEQRDVSAKLTSLLQSYANGLTAGLRGVEAGASERPMFPPRTGVIDTFRYIGSFLPIAAVTAVVELIFPMTLFLYTLFSLRATLGRGDDDDANIVPGGPSIKPVDEPPLPRRPRPVRAE